jgi:hypothetical protein
MRIIVFADPDGNIFGVVIKFTTKPNPNHIE